MTSDREAFLAGERPDDVCLFLDGSTVSDIDALTDAGERTEDGVVLVVEGEAGRTAFRSATGIDPMQFAKEAMGTDGTVYRDLTGGDCPGDGADHAARFVFAFAEEQNESVGGLYAEGDVIHAYVSCTCGTAYSEKWVAGE